MMMFSIFILLLYCSVPEILSAKSKNKSGKKGLRVVGGKEDTNNDYLYVVAISSRSGSVSNGITILRSCTGSLISIEWVLTAGHCINKRDDTRIQYGDLTAAPNSSEAKFSTVLKSISHPRYSANNDIQIRNDIGLMFVEKVDLTAFGKLSAVDYMSLIGFPVTYVGVGWTVRYKDMKIVIEDQTRARQYGQGAVIRCRGKRDNRGSSYPAICLGSKCSDVKEDRGVSYGDMGGPLLHAGRIVGVCSFGNFQNSRKIEMRFTPVSPFLDWIASTLHT